MKITEEVKTLIRRLNACFQLEKKRRSPIVAYEHVTKRVANALSLPCFTVSKVVNENSSGMFYALLNLFSGYTLQRSTII